ncbi:MAG TPA: formate dehydrogenase accessory sulfurtransferase FdhD [Rugosibacter sp.]
MKATVELPVIRLQSSVRKTQVDRIAEEIPVAFEYNGIVHTVMLATPADLEDFALGFSLSEGIVEQRKDVFDIDVIHSESGITLRLSVAGDAFARLKERRRSLAGRTGCGLCGAESLAQVMRDLPAVLSPVAMQPAVLYQGMAKLPAHQKLQQITGATHAACWVSSAGEISHVREDIGRHNALDKTIGALATTGFDAQSGAILITSRASFEMVQKSAAMGVGIVAAVSAPTAAAVRLAEQLNVTLVGFLRNEQCVIYTGKHLLLENTE